MSDNLSATDETEGTAAASVIVGSKDRPQQVRVRSKWELAFSPYLPVAVFERPHPTRDRPAFESLPQWNDEDVARFVQKDPIYGPQMAALQQAGVYSRQIGIGGALGMAAFFGYRTKSLLGVVAGAAVGFFAGFEFAHGQTRMSITKGIDAKDVERSFLDFWRKENGLEQPPAIKFRKGRVSEFLGFRKAGNE
eukprot:TRINITY_DN3808_c0_g1_i1.p1 TRINITY_DN3808_c0_g1~~TRINITY_DN3808_c0_g1_i1.p1  ORF type:complete len:193 (-),score=50.02 TRINITY_DN3808_c0_g1_i1:52-630(-)